MYPISDKFRAALTRSHKIATRVEVLSAGATIALLDDVTISGAVTVEKQAAIRRRFQAKVVDRSGTLTPRVATDLLTPYGNEVRLWRGIDFQDGTANELVPLGTFRLSRCEIVDADGVMIDLTGFDRSRTISRAKLTSPYTIAAGGDYSAAVHDLIDARMAGLVYHFASTTATTPDLAFLEGDDPWTHANDMATSFGAEVFLDPLGDPVLRPEPDPNSGQIDWSYVEGPTATILGVKRVLDDEKTVNGYIVTGETTSNAVPVRGEAWDDNPSSPTFRGGPYGEAPAFVRSPLVTTNDQATDMAAGLLRSTLGLSERVTHSALVNPAHDSGDIVAIRRAASGVDAVYVLDSFAIPLDQGAAMSATYRERRTST